jgi:hypothetical protein
MEQNQTNSGVITQTITETTDKEQVLILRLTEEKKNITWADGTVDNEHMGKKSSKSMSLYLF